MAAASATLTTAPRWTAALAALAVAALLTASARSASMPTATPRGPLAVAQRQASAGASRIVSLVPATTEMLFDMGEGARLAGVGSFDRFPPDVQRLPRLGGLLDPDVERLLALKPDLVVMYRTQSDLRRQLERAGIPFFEYQHGSLSDIAETMRALGDRVGVPAKGDDAARRLEQRLSSTRQRVAGRPRPRTLLVFGRQPGSLRGINASGGVGFLHDLLELAGGTNLLGDIKQPAVSVSTEMLLARAPDVIIELVYGDSPRVDRIDAERRAWDALPAVPAVRTGRIHLLSGDEFVVPGPRVASAAERFARTLHPEVVR
ncbi:MAG: ABC transporter substrate-binding protein [Vicinamibacterales bacterium]